jgi:hypothetical protein
MTAAKTTAAKTTDTTEADAAGSEAPVLTWAERLFLGASACILAVELWRLLCLADVEN